MGGRAERGTAGSERRVPFERLIDFGFSFRRFVGVLEGVSCDGRSGFRLSLVGGGASSPGVAGCGRELGGELGGLRGVLGAGGVAAAGGPVPDGRVGDAAGLAADGLGGRGGEVAGAQAAAGRVVVLVADGGVGAGAVGAAGLVVAGLAAAVERIGEVGLAQAGVQAHVVVHPIGLVDVVLVETLCKERYNILLIKICHHIFVMTINRDTENSDVSLSHVALIVSYT